VPASAVQHWEGHGWERTDAPAKPRRPVKSYPPPVSATTDQAADAAAKTLDAPPLPTDTPPAKTTKTKAAPAGRKED
jgi:hypothetical protein